MIDESRQTSLRSTMAGLFSGLIAQPATNEAAQPEDAGSIVWQNAEEMFAHSFSPDQVADGTG